MLPAEASVIDPAPAAIDALTVGVNGPREGAQGRACRGYSLAYSTAGARRFDEERLSDVWWTLAEHDDNTLDIRSDRRVRSEKSAQRGFSSAWATGSAAR